MNPEMIVPSYLKEDHPAPIPNVAMKLIERIGKQKGGNGVPAEQLDQELTFMFCNCPQKPTKPKAASKSKHRDILRGSKNKS